MKDFDESERQLILLALAELALSRPGWDWTISETVKKFMPAADPDTCVVCSAQLQPPTEPPHCQDCIVPDDYEKPVVGAPIEVAGFQIAVYEDPTALWASFKEANADRVKETHAPTRAGEFDLLTEFERIVAGDCITDDVGRHQRVVTAISRELENHDQRGRA